MNGTPLPFFFRPVGDGYLITNQTGSFRKLGTEQQLRSIISGRFEDIPAALLSDLKSGGFVCSADELDVRLNTLSSSLATRWDRALKGPSLVMIVPTLNCDHDCRYCQVSRAPLGKTGVSLSVDDIEPIIRLIEELPAKDVKVEFQGGEPLVRFDWVREFVRQLSRSTKNISYVICSALGPLSDEIVSWAAKNKVQFSVSLDGAEPQHLINRPSRYFNSFEKTVEGIERLRGTLGPAAVSCLATISKSSLPYPNDVVDSYVDLGMDRIFLRPISPFGFASKSSDEASSTGYSVEEFMVFYRQAMSRVAEHNELAVLVEDQAYIHLQRIYQSASSGYVDLQSPAGFLLGALVVNYDGKVFGSDEARMLWQSTKEDQLALGRIGDPLTSLLDSKPARGILERSFTACMPGCDECAYQPYCGSDPLYHLSAQGDDVGDKSISWFCQFQQAMFDFIFEELEADNHLGQVMKSWLRQ